MDVRVLVLVEVREAVDDAPAASASSRRCRARSSGRPWTRSCRIGKSRADRPTSKSLGVRSDARNRSSGSEPQAGAWPLGREPKLDDASDPARFQEENGEDAAPKRRRASHHGNERLGWRPAAPASDAGIAEASPVPADRCPPGIVGNEAPSAGDGAPNAGASRSSRQRAMAPGLTAAPTRHRRRTRQGRHPGVARTNSSRARATPRRRADSRGYDLRSVRASASASPPGRSLVLMVVSDLDIIERAEGVVGRARPPSSTAKPGTTRSSFAVDAHEAHREARASARPAGPAGRAR